MEIINKPKDKALLSVQFNQLAKPLMKTGYGKYLMDIIEV